MFRDGVLDPSDAGIFSARMRPLSASLEACGQRPGKPWRLFVRLNAVTPRNYVKRPPRIYVARAKPAFCALSAPMRAGLCARLS